MDNTGTLDTPSYQDRQSPWTIFMFFLRLGFTSFGGPSRILAISGGSLRTAALSLDISHVDRQKMAPSCLPRISALLKANLPDNLSAR